MDKNDVLDTLGLSGPSLPILPGAEKQKWARENKCKPLDQFRNHKRLRFGLNARPRLSQRREVESIGRTYRPTPTYRLDIRLGVVLQRTKKSLVKSRFSTLSLQ